MEGVLDVSGAGSKDDEAYLNQELSWAATVALSWWICTRYTINSTKEANTEIKLR